MILTLFSYIPHTIFAHKPTSNILHSTLKRKIEMSQNLTHKCSENIKLMTSIIFVTIGGPYSDEYIEGSTEMIWKGQNKGRRDERVTRGTKVWFRNNPKKKCFKLLGTVESIEQMSPGDTSKNIASTYKLILNLFDAVNQIEIKKASGDRTTHQNILRSEGYSEDIIEGARWYTQGIY